MMDILVNRTGSMVIDIISKENWMYVLQPRPNTYYMYVQLVVNAENYDGLLVPGIN